MAGEVVAVEWDKMDRYGRKVGKVLLGGQDANLRQIQRGLALQGLHGLHKQLSLIHQLRCVSQCHGLPVVVGN